MKKFISIFILTLSIPAFSSDGSPKSPYGYMHDMMLAFEKTVLVRDAVSELQHEENVICKRHSLSGTNMGDVSVTYLCEGNSDLKFKVKGSAALNKAPYGFALRGTKVKYL